MKRSALVLTLALLCSIALDGRPRPPQYSIVDLGTLPGGGFSNALNVNDRGQIVGLSGAADGTMHAVLWDNGVVIDLGTLGGTSSAAWDINNRGQIVGESDNRAFLWQDGEMFDLSEAGPFNRAFAINQRAQVVGHFQFEGVLWQKGTLTSLGILSAVDINDHGVVAGTDNVNDEFHAVLWQRGEVIDLGTSDRGGTGGAARCGINNRGQVVGDATVDGGLMPSRAPLDRSVSR